MKHNLKASGRRDFLKLTAWAPLPFLLFSTQAFTFSRSTSHQKKVFLHQTQREWQTKISEIAQRYGAEFGDIRPKRKEG